MTTPPALPAWPERGCEMCRHDSDWSCFVCRDHERQRADAAMARLSVAVKAMWAASTDNELSLGKRKQILEMAMVAIGPLPPLPPTETKEPNEQGTGA